MKYKVGDIVITDLENAINIEIEHTGITRSMEQENNTTFIIKTVSKNKYYNYSEYLLDGSICWWSESMLKRKETSHDKYLKTKKKNMKKRAWFNLRA